MIKQIRATCAANLQHLHEINNTGVMASRWCCSRPSVVAWRNNRDTRLAVLTLGFVTNYHRTDYPLCDDLETIAAIRGLEIPEIERMSGYCRNSLKNFMRNTETVKRFWDIIEGCVCVKL